MAKVIPLQTALFESTPARGVRPSGVLKAYGLTPRQRACIVALLRLPINKAAVELGVKPQTVYLWLKETPFRKALADAQSEVFSHGVGQIKGAVTVAVENLLELVHHHDPMVSLRATHLILEHASKLMTAEEFAKRLEALERSGDGSADVFNSAQLGLPPPAEGGDDDV